ncbi:ketosynthase chain-length factor [Actinophytocola xinjiangensis]|uniref:Ketosynthase chain-length factor n=1 Tax=Actinophytocola xinjiangensis TaxID=485602 RepID=A0A7Z0WPX3_9PSEU|nr:beta-ketoacyl synthase N-terminal-like domain-containing protein [Actinophytocola xinjiangensis]OLF12764.1 ketosynthase chain-length factor [Actinophytocola xinjiangensis]
MTGVVVTGLGVVAPTGSGADQFWAATLAGDSGVRPISRFDPAGYPVREAGEVREFDPTGLIDPRVVVQTDLWTQFALVATRQALDAAGLDPAAHDPFDIGVTTSASSGGNAFGQREIQALWAQGPRFVGPYQSIAWFYAASTGQISIAHNLRGPCAVLSTESAGGLDAVAHARTAIRGGCRVQVCGGTEAPVSPYALTCQLPSGLLAETGGYRPFARDAGGYLPGEGGAVLVLEDDEHAARRGAPALARVAGHAATFAGGDDWALSTEALTAAIRLALADAGVPAREVDVVFADAMGVPGADAAEVAALAATVGAVPVTAPKAGLGRAYSGTGALDVATAALALATGRIPPTPGVTGADLDHDLDLVTGRARDVPLRHALLLARGFGGFTSALVLSSPAHTDN